MRSKAVPPLRSPPPHTSTPDPTFPKLPQWPSPASQYPSEHSLSCQAYPLPLRSIPDQTSPAHRTVSRAVPVWMPHYLLLGPWSHPLAQRYTSLSRYLFLPPCSRSDVQPGAAMYHLPDRHRNFESARRRCWVRRSWRTSPRGPPSDSLSGVARASASGSPCRLRLALAFQCAQRRNSSEPRLLGLLRCAHLGGCRSRALGRHSGGGSGRG